MQGINIADIAVIGLLVLSAIVGIARGFTREFFGIIAWICALAATLFGIIWARPYMQGFIKNPLIADVVSGVVIFVLVLFILGSLSRYLSIRVKGSALGGLDRSLGLLFGVARGAIVLVIAYFVTSLFWNPEKWPQEIKEARSLSYIVDGANWLRSLVPEDAIKNLGLRSLEKEEEEETATMGESVDNVVKALSQPTPVDKTASSREDQKEKKEGGYAEGQRGDLDRLIKNND